MYTCTRATDISLWKHSWLAIVAHRSWQIFPHPAYKQWDRQSQCVHTKPFAHWTWRKDTYTQSSHATCTRIVICMHVHVHERKAYTLSHGEASLHVYSTSGLHVWHTTACSGNHPHFHVAAFVTMYKHWNGATVYQRPATYMYNSCTAHGGWWFNYPGPLHNTEIELPCLSGERRLCLCITFKDSACPAELPQWLSW